MCYLVKKQLLFSLCLLALVCNLFIICVVSANAIRRTKSDDLIETTSDDLSSDVNQLSIIDIQERIRLAELEIQQQISRIHDEMNARDELINREVTQRHLNGSTSLYETSDFFTPRIIEHVVDSDDGNGTEQHESNLDKQLDPWSVAWYIGSFGGLISFFLIVSCSEWCCRNGSHDRRFGACSRTTSECSRHAPDTPPPAYDEFAPPPYSSIYVNEKGVPMQAEIFIISKGVGTGAIVPVHTSCQTLPNLQQLQGSPGNYTSPTSQTPGSYHIEVESQTPHERTLPPSYSTIDISTVGSQTSEGAGSIASGSVSSVSSVTTTVSSVPTVDSTTVLSSHT